MSSMFTCLVDCANFDLLDDCAGRDAASVPDGQHRRNADGAQQQGVLQRTPVSPASGFNSESGGGTPGGPYHGGGSNEQDYEEERSGWRQEQSCGARNAPDAGQGPSGHYGGSGDLQALSVDAARIAREQKIVTATSGLTVGVPPPISASSDGYGYNAQTPIDPVPNTSSTSDEASVASAAAKQAAIAGRRASESAADAVAAAAAAADAGTREEAEAAADRAAKAAANAAAGAAGAARAAKEAGKAAAAEQAAMDAAMAGGAASDPVRALTQGGGVSGAGASNVWGEGAGGTEVRGGGSGAAGAGGIEEVERSNGAMATGGAAGQGKSYGRSVSMGDSNSQTPVATPAPMSDAFLSAPGTNEVQAALTPGREQEGEKTWLMARRVVAKWGDKPDLSAPDSPARTFVSTRLRHLRLSPDGSTLVVKSEQGGVDHELALDELLEVHETPSEESVTLMGWDVEIRIAFKGQAKALKQFRNMLVPAGGGAGASPATANGLGVESDSTMTPAAGIDAPPSQQAPRSVMPAINDTVAAGLLPVQGDGVGVKMQSNGNVDGSESSRPPRLSAAVAQMQSSTSNLGGASGMVSPVSTASGWGSVKAGATAGTQRQLAPPTAGGLGASAGHRERLSSAGGSTFADARERERVIASLQNNSESMSDVEREAKLHLVKYEQAGFVRGYEALCDQQQVRLRKRPEFAELESIGVAEGLADPSIVLRQPNSSKSVDVHFADAVRAKALLDEFLEELAQSTPGVYVRSVPVKEQESIKRKASNDYGGDVRRVLDMARTSVICETPDFVRQLIQLFKDSPAVAKIGRMKNGFGSTAVGRGGYRDIKVNLQPTGIAHFAEVQVHLREFYELNSRSHEVYEWARGVDLPEGTTPHLLFRNLSPDVQAEMTRLVKEDWMGLKRILPELLQATEQYQEAEPLLRQNVEDAEKRWMIAKMRFGEGHLHEMSCAQGVAMALNNLALALKGRGDTQGAEPLLRRALQMSVDSQGAEHPEVATRLNSLALLLASDGKVEEAEDLHRQALDIARKVYGPEHADVATYLNNLARVLKAQDKLQEAEPLQRSALAIGERMLGTNHSDVATYYNNLSRLVRAAGKLEEAEPLQRRAVEIGEKVLGPNSPDLATWVNNLGRLLMARKKLAEAETVQERAVTIAENVYGPDHAQVARARKNLTKVRWALGKAARSRAPGKTPDTSATEVEP